MKRNLDLAVRLAPGQTIDDIRDQTERIRSIYRARRCAVEQISPTDVRIRIVRRDPLADGVRNYRDRLRRPHGIADLPIGIDEAGDEACLNFTQLPHALVAGTTGAGKSGIVNAILAASVTATPPASLVLIDPKRVELAMWQSAAIRLATDPDELETAVSEAKSVMDYRYSWMEENGVKNLIGDQNALEKLGGPLLVVIDELAEFLAISGKDGGQSVASIAQLGRAAAVFVICATQNPKAELFSKSNGTETLRSNLNNLIAGRVSRRSDSDVILGQGEAALGNDASALPPELPGVAIMGGKSERIRAAYLSDEEIAQIASFRSIDYGLKDLEKWCLEGEKDESAYESAAD